MKRIPSYKEFQQNPEYWQKEMAKPDPKGTEIFLMISFFILGPISFFYLHKIVPGWTGFYKALGIGLVVFAFYTLYLILFEKQIRIRRIKKEYGGKNIQLTKDEKTGEEIIVIEEN